MNRVFIGDRLLGEYDPRDHDLGPRNVMLVMLARQPEIHLGQLAAAFELSDEHLRRLRQAAKADGYGAVLTRARGCTKREKIAPAKVRELRALFEEGWNPTDATRRQRRRGRVSRSTVSRERRRWQAEKQAAQGIATRPVVATESRQVRFEDGATAVVCEGDKRAAPFVHANVSTLIVPNALDSTSCAIVTGAVDTVERTASTATDVLAKAANDALATSGNGVILDALAVAADTMTADVAVDMPVGPANTDGLMVEFAITGDVLAEGITDAIVGEGDDMTSVHTDDGVATDALVTELTAAASDDLEPPEAGAVDVLADEEHQPGPVAPLRSRPVAGGRLVQHVGSWLLMALAHHHGLHQEAERLAGGDATRIAVAARALRGGSSRIAVGEFRPRVGAGVRPRRTRKRAFRSRLLLRSGNGNGRASVPFPSSPKEWERERPSDQRRG